MLMTDQESIRRFATAGRAVLTLANRKRGTHVTLKLRANQRQAGQFFVSANTGPERFTYLGMTDAAGKFWKTQGTAVNDDHPALQAAKFFCERVLGDGFTAPSLEIRHEGKCGRCGRPLTDPGSIDAGLGPDCAGKMAA